MKWHRLLFWLLFLGFFTITIGVEGGQLKKEGAIRFILYTSLTAALIFGIDRVLFPKLLIPKKYWQFVFVLLLSVAVVLLMLQEVDRLLFGASVGSWSDQLIGQAVFIIPWVFVALCLFIAEDYGRLSLEKTRNELQYLRHQINPHFLLNTHNNIHFLIEQDPQLASATLLQLSGIMQYMLYECSADTVPLSKELNNLINYIHLEKIRQEPILVVQHNLNEITNDALIAPLLLLSFIENAFKHVSRHNNGQNFITIKAAVANNELHFSVQNSKTNIHAVDKPSGIGLNNVQQRLKLLYPKRHSLVIRNEPEHFDVTLTLQLQKQ